MSLRTSCQRPASKHDGSDRRRRQQDACAPRGRDFTAASVSAFAGFRWPAEVILTAVCCDPSLPLSSAHVMQLWEGEMSAD